jgi:hypothetical protein
MWEAWEQDYSSLELTDAEFVTACLSEVLCPHGKTLPLGRKTMKQIVLSAQVRCLHAVREAVTIAHTRVTLIGDVVSGKRLCSRTYSS